MQDSVRSHQTAYWFLTVALIGGCGFGNDPNTEVLELRDVTTARTLILKKKPEQAFIHSFQIEGRGQVNGHATITLMLNDTPYKVQRLSGTVRFSWGGDWYTDAAEVRYEPQDVSGGTLTLKYRFDDLKR